MCGPLPQYFCYLSLLRHVPDGRPSLWRHLLCLLGEEAVSELVPALMPYPEPFRCCRQGLYLSSRMAPTANVMGSSFHNILPVCDHEVAFPLFTYHIWPHLWDSHAFCFLCMQKFGRRAPVSSLWWKQLPERSIWSPPPTTKS